MSLRTLFAAAMTRFIYSRKDSGDPELRLPMWWQAAGSGLPSHLQRCPASLGLPWPQSCLLSDRLCVMWFHTHGCTVQIQNHRALQDMPQFSIGKNTVLWLCESCAGPGVPGSHLSTTVGGLAASRLSQMHEMNLLSIVAVTELLTIVAPLVELCLHNILRQEFGCIPALCTELVNCCRVAHTRRSLYCMLHVGLHHSLQAPEQYNLFAKTSACNRPCADDSAPLFTCHAAQHHMTRQSAPMMTYLSA